MNTFKKYLLTLIVFGAILIVKAQAPNKMSFQTVLRNNLGKLVVNKSVGVRLSILKTTSTGSAVYVETHTKTSNVNGLVTLEVGTGNVTTGTFASIDWSQGPYFLKTEMDVNGGANYSISGVTEFVSVPYALSVKSLSNGSNVGDMNYWNGTTWVPLAKGSQGQTLTFCDGKPTWAVGGVCPGTITSLICSSATNKGILTTTSAASGATSVVDYVGGNGGSYTGQKVSSTGVTGLTATLQAGNFNAGLGGLTYTITGTPSANGIASFALNVGGKTCTLNRTVGIGEVSLIDCFLPTNNGTLSALSVATDVSSEIFYDGGNGLPHTGQVVTSTGVTGLTATLQAGNFVIGSGSLIYTITGTPSTSGTATFALNIGGKTCTLTRTVSTAQLAEINFTSIGSPVGSFQNNISDIDGNTYKTVQIGTQVWMAENLKTSKYNDGTGISNVTNGTQWSNLTSGAWSYYNNDAANNAKYGKLYNWYTVNPTSNSNKNLCPRGWHVPTDPEWTVLTDYLGGESVAGGKMKEIGTTSWQSPNTGGANTSLFTSLPGGLRFDNGDFNFFGSVCYWWSLSVKTTGSWGRSLDYISGGAYRNDFPKCNGYSIRCIKD